MMGGKMRRSVVLGSFLIATIGASCKKPQLRSDKSGEPDGDPIAAEQPSDDFRSLRKKVIGQRFENLTLGSRKFSDAEVRDITDEEIVIAHAAGVDKVSWGEVTDEVREKWGYNPASKSIFSKITDILPQKEESSIAENEETESLPKTVVSEAPKVDTKQLARQIVQQRKMLESQLAGIRNIESELARHSAQLAELKNRLYALQAAKKRTRSGGIVVERVNGKARKVGSGNEAAEVAGKVQVEEQLVAQLTKSLQAARDKYLEMKRELDRLESQF